MRAVEVGGLRCGGGSPLLWIAGPCVIETRDLTLSIADTLAKLASRHDVESRFITRRGRNWRVAHGPISRQRMVLLKRAGATAGRFYQYLRQPTALATLRQFGFVAPQ